MRSFSMWSAIAGVAGFGVKVGGPWLLQWHRNRVTLDKQRQAETKRRQERAKLLLSYHEAYKVDKDLALIVDETVAWMEVEGELTPKEGEESEWVNAEGLPEPLWRKNDQTRVYDALFRPHTIGFRVGAGAENIRYTTHYHPSLYLMEHCRYIATGHHSTLKKKEA